VHPLCEQTSGLIRTTIWPDRILSRVAGREERKHQECLYKPQRPTSFPILKTFSSRTSSSFFVHLCLHQIPLERTFIAHLSIDFTYQASSPARYHFAIFNPILILAISPNQLSTNPTRSYYLYNEGRLRLRRLLLRRYLLLWVRPLSPFPSSSRISTMPPEIFELLSLLSREKKKCISFG
jgi:hypothetical protein